MKGRDGQWTARCPAHGDSHQSLSVSIGRDGRVLMKCHAGCPVEDIVGAMGLQMKDLFVETTPEQAFRPSGKSPVEARPLVAATYDYRDDAGSLLAQKLRRADKSFIWRRPDGKGGWIYNRQGVPHRLYVAGELGGVVHICEGEKDADNFHGKIGGCAVSGADGAGPGKWKPEYTQQLQDRPVVILPDNDAVGHSYAQETAAALHGVAKSVRLLDLSQIWPEIPEHGDISDMIEALGAAEAAQRLVELEKKTPEWSPGDSFAGFAGEPKPENGFSEFLGFLGPDLRKNPSFPVEEFSRELRNFSVCAGASLQTAVDMPAVSALAAASLCAQRKFKTHVQARHFEPVNLYLVTVANPSERKSPTISFTMGPVYRYQKEENERRRPLIEEYRTKRDMLQRRIESLKKSATSEKKAKSDSPATVEDIMMLNHELEDLERDALDYISLTADDITMEALTSKMVANGEKMALVSSEGGIFNILSGLYTGGVANIDLILKSWSGDHVSVDRKGRPPEVLLSPTLTINLMVQPNVLEAVMNNVEFSGKGLNARFLYAIPASKVGSRPFQAPDIPVEVMEEYNGLLQSLLAIPDTGEPRMIEMTAEALGELERIHNEIEPRLVGNLANLGGWGGKYEGTVVRIAGLLHVCDHRERAAELELSRILQGYGYPVEAGRAQSYGEVPDLSCLPGIHIECKRAEALRLSEWMEQARRDAERFGGLPAVFHRRNREGWRVTMALPDWMELYRSYQPPRDSNYKE